MIETPEPVVRLRAVTREIDALDDALSLTSPSDPVYWGRGSDVMVARGAVADLPAHDREAMGARWRSLIETAEIDDPVRLPGTGLIALGSFAFDAGSADPGGLRIPEVIVGRRGGRSWVTRISPVDAHATSAGPELPVPQPLGPYWSATLGPGAMEPEDYRAAVARALGLIAAGDVGKIVIARDLVGSVPAGADLRRLVRALATGYPDTWTFAFDGLIGASPETLVTVSGGTVTARVLAGTAPRGADADEDTATSLALLRSAKDLDEHQYAVQSVLAALRPSTSALAAAEQPFALKLPNLWHLATDVEGTLDVAASSLDLALRLHPTAAVAGTPRDAAIEQIGRIEPFDRGRYAGPVGWVGAGGDGEWAIALRCARFDLDTPRGAPVPLTAYAGAGIVAGSDPEAELLETRVKFRPIVDALA